MQNVGELQSRLGKYTKALSDLKSEKDQLNRQHGSKTTERERRETERKELTLKDENNRRIEVYKASVREIEDTIVKALSAYRRSQELQMAKANRTIKEAR